MIDFIQLTENVFHFWGTYFPEMVIKKDTPPFLQSTRAGRDKTKISPRSPQLSNVHTDTAFERYNSSASFSNDLNETLPIWRGQETFSPEINYSFDQSFLFSNNRSKSLGNRGTNVCAPPQNQGKCCAEEFLLDLKQKM